MPKLCELGSSSKSKFVVSRPWPCLKALMSLGGLEMSFARGTIYTSHRIGRVEEVVSLILVGGRSGLGVVFGWWVWWVVLGGVRFLCGGVSRSRGSASPLHGRVVSVLN